jgi:hypothetical protein
MKVQLRPPPRPPLTYYAQPWYPTNVPLLLGHSQPQINPFKKPGVVVKGFAGESCNETGNMLRFSAEGLNEQVLGTFSVQMIPLSCPEFTTRLQLSEAAVKISPREQ